MTLKDCLLKKTSKTGEKNYDLILETISFEVIKGG